MNTTIMKRDPSIDILKFLAAFFITNSHMEQLYPPPFTALSTGGAIGDVLFFFCSGYTLFLGKQMDFPNWYKRRINRIYPTVFMWALVSAALFSSNANMVDIVLHGGGWFVTCIMIYYVLLWVIRKYFINRLYSVFAVVTIVVLVWYLFFFDSSIIYMYKNTYFKWCHYFLFMLLGSMLGLKWKEHNSSISQKLKPLPTLIKLFACVLFFYGLQIAGVKWTWVAHLQIITLIPLLGITYYLYELCNTDCVLGFYAKKWPHRIIYWIGALCLEIYLCQRSIFTGAMNSIFPLNVLIMFILVCLFAYVIKILSNWFSQTFRSEPYDWKSMVKL